MFLTFIKFALAFLWHVISARYIATSFIDLSALDIRQSSGDFCAKGIELYVYPSVLFTVVPLLLYAIGWPERPIFYDHEFNFLS